MLFESRFLEKHAGQIMSDPPIAIVELVANCWDAYATRVDIIMPNKDAGIPFRITDNGVGMGQAAFERIWRTIDYDRLSHQGTSVTPPDDLPNLRARPVFGRNGRGRYAMFCFAPEYRVRSWREGKEFTSKVKRGVTRPLDIDLISSGASTEKHGTEITGEGFTGTMLEADHVREILSSRFLIDPQFEVMIDGKRVEFEDVPKDSLIRTSVEIDGIGTVTIIQIDTKKADRTARQHGIAWWVNRRLVGKCEWRASDYERILDGRTTEAKRNTFIVQADILGDAVLPDWTGFDAESVNWKLVQTRVQDEIGKILKGQIAERRSQTKDAVVQRHSGLVSQMAPLSRDRWNKFVSDVVTACPTLGEAEISQLATVLANLEIADSQYGLLQRLHTLQPDDLDQLHDILTNWTVKMAKIVLDEVETRLKLIHELYEKVFTTKTDELHELQPLFQQGLWIFGPEFESIEFTSNKGMTTVMRELFGDQTGGSRNRPDFVVRTDSTVGFYSRPSFNHQSDIDGVAHLVIVELKRPGVPLGKAEKDQVWTYVKELKGKGHVRDSTRVTGYVLGSEIEPFEDSQVTQGDRITIVPRLYSVVLKQAEARMMNLYDRLKDAPFLSEKVDAAVFTGRTQVGQSEMAV